MGEPRTLVNGHWEMSIPYILSNPDAEQSLRATQDAAASESLTGVLTRTMVRSPVTKWILPARVRHRDKNDVIFVGEHSIEVREFFRGRRHLQSVATKADFDSKIRAARIFGEERKPSSAYTEPDHDDYESRGTLDADNTAMDESMPQRLPPQMLALTLQAGPKDSLAFLFAYNVDQDRVEFISSVHPLRGSSDEACRLGTQMAIDPRSLAIAVAAQSDSLMIYTLKSMATMRRENERHIGLTAKNFKPIKEERLLQLNGNILKMEFLHPPRDHAHRNTVILAIIFRPHGKSQADRTYLRYAEWDCSRPLHELDINFEKGCQLPMSEGLPWILIPLTISTGALLVCRNHMLKYPDLLIGHSTPVEVKYNTNGSDSKSLGNLEGPSIPRHLRACTGWARPVRRMDHATNTDSLYLCRQDGSVSFCELTTEGRGLTEHFAGKLDVSLDAAFACLDIGLGEESTDVDHGSFDVLVIAGEMSDGGLFEFKSRQKKLPRLQRLRNWAPTRDFTVISQPDRQDDLDTRTASCSITNRDRLFACAESGQQHGTICEMRYGVEAQSSFAISLSSLGDIDGRLIQNIWLLPEFDPLYSPPDLAHKPDHAVVYVSYPDATERFTVSWDGRPLLNSPSSYTESLLDRSGKTIAASTTKDHLAIQITEHSIRVIGVPSIQKASIPLFQHSFAPQEITHASIGRSSTCLLALRSAAGNSLMILHLEVVRDQVHIPAHSVTTIALPCEVSSVSLTNLSSRFLALVGTTDGRILIYGYDGETLKPFGEHVFDGDIAICGSICVIKKPTLTPSKNEPVVLCGLRNGTLHLLKLDVSSSDCITLNLCEKLNIGLTAVSIYADYISQTNIDGAPSRAIALSGDCFCKIFYGSSDAARITAQCIWITHPENQAFPSSTLSSIAQLSPWDRGGSVFDKSLFCMDQYVARLVRLDADAQSVAVPRSINIQGTPTRVIYVSRHRKLVVAFEHVYTSDPGTTSNSQSRLERRMRYSMLRTIDPDDEDDFVKNEVSSSDSNMIPDLPAGCEVVGNSGEKILGIVNWEPNVNGRVWSLLAVNTLRIHSSGAKESGCIYIYHMQSLPDGSLKLTRKKIQQYDKPVYAMAAFGPDSLVFSLDNELVVQQLASPDNSLKLITIAQAGLRSPAKHISVNRDRDIYVSLNKGSVVHFTLVGQSLVEKLHDRIDRTGLHNVFVPEHSILVASDMQHRVRGLYHSAIDPIDLSFRPVFEATLPVKIVHLQIASLDNRGESDGGGKRQEIIGSAMDGSFYSFTFLSSYSEWRLLCFVQNLVRRTGEICPFTYREFANQRIEPEINLRNMHINGDVLARLFYCGNHHAVATLRKLVEASHDQADRQNASRDQGTAFSDLVVSAIPATGEERDAYEAAIEHLRRILRIDS